MAVNLKGASGKEGSLVVDPPTEFVAIDFVGAWDEGVTIFFDVTLQQPQPELPRRGRRIHQAGLEGGGELLTHRGRHINVDLAGQLRLPALAAHLAAQSVQLLAELGVVRPQRFDDIPDRLEHRRVQGDLGVLVGVDEHRDHDGADGLVVGLADRPPDRLHDVDLRPLRVDERHPVQRRDIDTLGQTAGVGQQAAFPVIEPFEMTDEHAALTGGHLTGGVLRPQRALGSLPSGHPVQHRRHRRGELPGGLDSAVEGDDPAQVELAHRLGQSDLPGQLVSGNRVLAVEGDEGAPVHPVLVGGVIHADDRHLVIGQQTAVDGLGEAQPVEHLAELLRIVHGGNLVVGFLGLPQHPPGEEAWGGGHEQPPFRLDRRRVQHGGEV